jgi:MFS-type transporter involved in bile tolerance (Atg22 family)
MAAKWVGVLLVAYIGSEITAYLTESRGVPNPLRTGPFAAHSLGWYLTQAATALVGMMAGGLCAYFAPARTWRAPTILIAIYFTLGMVVVPASSGWLLGAYFVLVAPLTLWFGAVVYRLVERAGDSVQARAGAQ